MRPVRGGPPIRRELKILIAIAAAIAIVDQITKAAVLARLFFTESVSVIPGLFNLVHYRNPGAAFSILSSGGTGRTVFLLTTSIVALIIIGFIARQARGGLQGAALGLIAGGALGNLVDRVRFGYVVDFLDFYIGGYHWPAFNVADSAITTGAILAVFAFYVKTSDS
ncbi:MAG: signal peptidase II [Deltaproteobacteria bacterium RIFCSPLOWO2_02_FULL_53_8]|nr:MAG: signal peptidase II [Deltaproteobacteria bacterium RIFCSPLOWO2_02_FULL_53_8]